jgi:hypothetical protein
MYRHCLFCQHDMGTNEVVERLPIGRRLAFDETRGRLWVVCRSCERWNLTPFDDRWEAIEECERQFRGTKLRISTDNIGLARVSEGLELIRIGEPMRPEMAAWRYGDQFGRRRRRHAVVATGALAAVGAIYAGLSALGIGGGMMYLAGRGPYRQIIDRIHRIKVVTTDGRLVDVVPSKAREARLQMDDRTRRIEISLEATGRTERWQGDDARLIASVVLPRANVDGAGKADIQRAVELISVTNLTADPLAGILGQRRSASGRALGLESLNTPQRLALEMALHEEQERKALHGELNVLEAQWRAAEEIAAIADSLAMPDAVEKRFAALRSGPK